MTGRYTAVFEQAIAAERASEAAGTISKCNHDCNYSMGSAWDRIGNSSAA